VCGMYTLSKLCAHPFALACACRVGVRVRERRCAYPLALGKLFSRPSQRSTRKTKAHRNFAADDVALLDFKGEAVALADERLVHLQQTRGE
jgi:hypothetical protein